MRKLIRLTCEHLTNPTGIEVHHPRLSWQLQTDATSLLQTAYRLQVAKDASFEDLLWDSGKVTGDQSVLVAYDGPSIPSATKVFWRVRVWDDHGVAWDWSDTAHFETFLEKSDWQASWIVPDWVDTVDTKCASALLRKTFTVHKGLQRATAYATSLGLYELHVNGEKADDRLFAPGWTSYKNQLQVQTYDLTEKLCPGENAIGAMLNDGWARGPLAWNGIQNLYTQYPALLVQLVLTYQDGHTQTILSDSTWRASKGWLDVSELYNGEVQSCEKIQKDWSKATYQDSTWGGVRILEQGYDQLVAQICQSVRITQIIKPLRVITTPHGSQVLDMGQNMVGWVRLHTTTTQGQCITLTHAEVLDQQGNLYTENLRKAKQQDTYHCTQGMHTYEPHFTYHGFRYVMVEGMENVDPADFMGCVIHSDLPYTSGFACSEPMVNQLFRNTLWGQRGNFVDVPTDCPQRDERLGWTADAQVFTPTACFNMDCSTFFAKYLRDLAFDSSLEKGVPHVVPNLPIEMGSGSSVWGDAATVMPFVLYDFYGDEQILTAQYDSMKQWVDHIHSKTGDALLWNTGHHFGDWLGLDAQVGNYVGATPIDLISTAWFAHSTALVAKAAAILGKKEDALLYTKLAKDIVSAFQREFITPTGRIGAPMQTAHILALLFDLSTDRKRTVKDLVALIHDKKDHLSTGFVGSPYINKVLTDNGHHELAVTLLLQKDFPSWLYPITKGATTIWEHWDGIQPDGSFWSANMNSFNHYAYGSIVEWLLHDLAGIGYKEKGYKKLSLRPGVTPQLDYAYAQYQTPYGNAACGWERKDGLVTITVTVPANTTATLTLPDGDTQELGSGTHCIVVG